ncbi:MAG: restriction endonuclease subunit S, partial [Oscillospiraceae bacterium]|nr:restriction endonuclease subunit S [Oscillospiraceae bacterium]
ALYHSEALIFGTGGNASIHYCNEPFSTSADCIVFFAKRNDFSVKLVYQYLSGNIHILQNGFKGAGIKHISKDYIEDIELNLPILEQQHQIASIFDKVTCTIELCNQIIEKLDLLVKAKFVEMFGDPVANPHIWEKIPLSELAEIKIGPFGTLLHKEDYISDGHALVNPSHIIDGKIAVDMKLTVSNEKYAELGIYHLLIDDVVMGRRGEMGRCAVVSENGLLCGTGSLIIRTNGRLKADYIQKILSFPSFKKTIEDMAVGQTMPNLNVSIVSNFMIICPPIEVQEQYYFFVEQTEKSKSAVKQVLEKAETLKKALMQKYFG